MENKNIIQFLENVALNLRIDSIKATTASKSGHPTSCLSAADIIAVIFFHELRYDIKNPHNPNNDRFILSKGHAIPVVYAAWRQLGVITEKELLDLRKFDSVLEGHPTPRFKYNEAATGSLGQGLAIGVGMAMNAKHDNLDYKTYVMLGDGESAEGSVWEACELASHYKLDNLITIVDCNRLGQSGESLDDHHFKVYANKFEAFGFKAFIIDGHNIKEILQTLDIAKNIKNQPVAIIAKTFKGFGIPEVQDKNGYHGKPFKKEEVDHLIKELKEEFKTASEYKQDKQYIPPMPITKNSNLESEDHNKHIDLKSDPHTDLFDKNKQIATRKAFGYALATIGKINKNIFTLDGDVKNSTFTQLFEDVNPNRFIQCFIAEQSMVGIATGLQLRGKIPFAATFAAFLTRAHDQIRMAGIGRNALRLCGSHCGVSIGEDGPSQMGLEDIAMFRAIPKSIVLYPSDGVCTYKLVELMSKYNDGISYIRTTRPATPILYDKDEEFKIGGCKVLKESENDKICIIAAGITLFESLKAYEELKKQNINVSIIDLYSIKPLDIQTIEKVVKKSNKKILTVEDHYIEGGIGETIASAFSKLNFSITKLAVTKLPRSGKPEKLLNYEEIDSENIIKKVLEIIK